MQFPILNDTIVAVATGWIQATMGVVRLSGPQSFAVAAALGLPPPTDIEARNGRVSSGRLRISGEIPLPASAFWFAGPRSYTGQDVVELHTTGCVPLLRAICDACLALGARRALPGEFTGRAFVCGKIDRSQVDGVLGLIHASDADSARSAARAARGDARDRRDEVLERLLRLLSLVEAGIDFVEEEDVRFVSSAEVVVELDAILALVARSDSDAVSGGLWHARPHVALVGRPNAGKSTLLNALLGYERAIVSPIVGTTRDVLSAELALPGTTIMLQDCAGLGESVDELEAAAHRASERTAELADLVLWVHASDDSWSNAERAACDRVPIARRILVVSKSDRGCADDVGGPPFQAVCRLSAISGDGLTALKQAIVGFLGDRPSLTTAAPGHDLTSGAVPAIERALIAAKTPGPMPDELLALELRNACSAMTDADSAPLDEAVLGRIFGQFCIGK